MAARMFRNGVGSFSDAAILFPLLILLGQKTSFQFPILFLSAGLLVIFSGFYFRVPMSVQPLKSIAIAALSVGATAPEVQMSGLLLSAVFFAFFITNSERWLQAVPTSWIHSLQFALGWLLIQQGVEMGFKLQFGFFLAVLILALILVVSTEKWDGPFLGILAALSLFLSLLFGVSWSQGQIRHLDFQVGFPLDGLRWPLVGSLLLPQLALTMANSVIATEDVCKRYFGGSAKAVNKSRLIGTIAAGNFVSAVFGGLPMCHGSGGVTALFKGGARDWTSNIYLGGFLLSLAVISIFYDIRNFQFPSVILGALLVAVGFFHLRLAKPTWGSKEGKVRIFSALVSVLWSKNLLIVLLIQALISFTQVLRFQWERKGV